MITDVYEEERKIGSLHEKIKDKVKIPDELRDYLKFKTTSLQGLFLDYYSNGGINDYIENSKAHFSIFIVAYDDFGRYRGDLLQMFIEKSSYFKGSGVRKPVSSDVIITKLQRFIDNNMPVMLEYKGQ